MRLSKLGCQNVSICVACECSTAVSNAGAEAKLDWEDAVDVKPPAKLEPATDGSGGGGGFDPFASADEQSAGNEVEDDDFTWEDV